jgi:hypothetical protein
MDTWLSAPGEAMLGVDPAVGVELSAGPLGAAVGGLGAAVDAAVGGPADGSGRVVWHAMKIGTSRTNLAASTTP